MRRPRGLPTASSEVGRSDPPKLQIGKNFPQIANVIKTKQAGDCVEFYYVWKKSKNYALWKQNYKHTFGGWSTACRAGGVGGWGGG